MRASEDLAWSSAVAPVRHTSNGDFSAGGVQRNGRRNATAFCDAGQVSSGASATFILEQSDDDSTYETLASSPAISAATAPWNGILEARPSRSWVRVTLRTTGCDATHTVTASAVLALADGPSTPEANVNAVVV